MTIEKKTTNSKKKYVESAKDIIAYKYNNQFVYPLSDTNEQDKYVKISINSMEGKKIYQDFLIFLLNMATYRLYGTTRKNYIEHSIGDGVYFEVVDQKIGKVNGEAEDIAKLKKEIKMLIEEKIFIDRVTISIDAAYDLMKSFDRSDVIKNLDFHNQRFVYIYKANDYYDYYPRSLPFNTGCSVDFDILPLHDGFILRFLSISPDKKKFELPKLLFSQYIEHKNWIKILNIESVGDINRLIHKRKIRDFILTEEALQEKKIAHIADSILMKKSVKFVLIAGPSSSGKTTFAKRLAIQLRVNGYQPIVLGMDDYFLPRSQTPKLPNGDYDFENIHALDLKLLNSDLTKLIKGEEIRLPRFNFITGEREESNHYLKLGPENILVMEGIHGLNDLLTSAIDKQNKYKIYISALNQLNLDHHNRIPTTDCRKIRRIVRDSMTRGYTAEETLARFPAITAGESTNIFPFQECADSMFNSSLTFELAVLRKHVMPLLRAIDYKSPVYNEAQDLIALFEHFLDINDDFVLNNSILREFISNSVFEY